MACSFLPTSFKGYLAWKNTFAQPPIKGNLASFSAEKESAKAQAAEERVINRFTDGDFGDLAMVQSAFKTDRIWTNPMELSEARVGEKIWTRCRVHSSRTKGKMTWILLRKGVASVQAVVIASEDAPKSKEMVVYAGKIPKESVIDIFGEVSSVPTPVTSATQSDVEIRVLKIYVVSASIPRLPFQLEDASKPEPTYAGCGLGVSEDDDKTIQVGQELRLNNRWLDLRTNANQGIFKISSAVCTFFRSFFLENGFVEIHSPKIIPRTSEGGSEIFRLDYFGRPACLAQSPQFYKQMGVMSDLCNVFEVGPVFRAENATTPRHMCEFVRMDFEMEIKEHYHEVLLMLGNLFVHIFDHINKYCQAELAAVHQQYPFRPLRYRPKNQTLVLGCRDAVTMLREAGERVGDTDELTTLDEKRLGQLVGAKYGTDFYIVDKYPANVRFLPHSCAELIFDKERAKEKFHLTLLVHSTQCLAHTTSDTPTLTTPSCVERKSPRAPNEYMTWTCLQGEQQNAKFLLNPLPSTLFSIRTCLLSFMAGSIWRCFEVYRLVQYGSLPSWRCWDWPGAHGQVVFGPRHHQEVLHVSPNPHSMPTLVLCQWGEDTRVLGGILGKLV